MSQSQRPLVLDYHKKFPIRYRFDEGLVHSDTLISGVGKNSARRLVLPMLTADEDPAAKIAAAKRLRVEIDLRVMGVAFFDFNVTGAAEAIKAIACQ